jgi:hypothetical protein
MIKKVKDENDKFLAQQAVFSKSFFNFASQMDDPLPYLCNIFEHSALSALAPKMKIAIHNFLEDGEKQQINYAADYFINEFNKILSIIINCSNFQILSCLLDPIKQIMADADIEKSQKLCTMFLESLPQVLQVRKQVQYVCDIIHEFIRAHINEAVEMKIDEKINEFINEIYSVSRSTMYYQSTNIAPLFASLLLFDNFDTSIIQQYAQQITLSGDNNTEFIKLYMKLSNEGKTDINTLISSLLSSKNQGDKDTAAGIMVDAILANPDNSKHIFDLAYKKNESYILFAMLHKRISDKRTLKLFETHPDYIIDALTAQDHNTIYIAEKIINAIFPSIHKQIKRSEFSIMDSDDEDYLPSENQTTKKHTIADDTEKGLLMKFFEAICRKIDTAAKSPTLFYKTQMTGSFTLIKILNNYRWALYALELTESAEDYERIRNLIVSLKNLNVNRDMNLRAAINCALTFSEDIYHADFITLVRALLMENQDSQYIIYDFGSFLDYLRDMSDRNKIEFFSSDVGEFIASNYISQSFKPDDSMIESATMCYNLNSQKAMRFVKRLFSDEMHKKFQYTADVITKLLITTRDKLDEHCIINYAIAFTKLITMRAKHSNNLSSCNFKFCIKACSVLCEDLRWYGNVDVSNVVLYPNVVARMDQTEACIPVSLFIIRCMPFLNLTELYSNCMNLYDEVTSPESQSGLLCIILKCILLTKGDDEEEVIGKMFSRISYPLPFVKYAISCITKDTKWHIPVTKHLVKGVLTDNSKLFVAASIKASQNMQEIIDELTSTHYDKWNEFLKDIKTEETDQNYIDFEPPTYISTKDGLYKVQ